MLAYVMRSDAAAVHRDVLPAALLRLASDERLVAQVRAGSERAFEALFDRHHRPIFAFCRHILGSPADAEDAVQHTFLAAYTDLLRSEKPIALRPWLYTIARHRCVSVLRDRRERPLEELPEPATDHLAAAVLAREDVRTALTDVARLPDDQRAALILAELGDLSHEEIARILGCQREKVKALVFQARSSLTADRTARETPCAEIRAQLATLGGALRHTNLRRHLRDCEDCREFRHQMRAQRRRLGVLLPVAPTYGLKQAVLGALSSSGGASVTVGALGSGGLAVTALMTVAVASATVTAPVPVGGTERTQARSVAIAPAPPAAPTGAVRGRAPAERSRRFVRVPEFSSADLRDQVGTEADQRARPRDTSGEAVRSAPGDADGKVERDAARAPAPSGEAAQPASGQVQATRHRRAERRNSHREADPRRPTSPPREGGNKRANESTTANGHGKPATPPRANGEDDSTAPNHHAKPPPGPTPDAARETAAPPEPLRPATSNAGGSGKQNDGDTGPSRASGKP
jgi:RNA polymerase sigma factor (sigma-70 family)